MTDMWANTSVSFGMLIVCIGPYEDLLKYLREGQIIPYIIFYKIHDENYRVTTSDVIEEEKYGMYSYI
jgi:hypothetical protein